MKKGLIFLTVFFILLVFFIAKMNATQAKTTYQTIIVPAGETIEDNFVRFGNEIIIDGTVNGDVIVGANTITINGDVAGDILAVAANAITINGQVTGNVRIAGNFIEINNTVGKNVNIAAKTARLSKNASVGWTLSFVVNSLAVNGPVGGNIYGYGNNVTLNNSIGNNVTLFLGETGQATLMPETIISGSFNYSGSKNAIIQSGAEIKGDTVHQLIPQYIESYRKFLSRSWLFTKIIHLFSVLLIGVIIVTLFKKIVNQVTHTMWAEPGKSMLWGIACLIVTPLVIVLVSITIIGIPLALISFVVYLILLYLAQIFVGTLIGQKLIGFLGQKKKDEKNKPPLIWAMMLGTVIFTILVNIPYLGFLIGLIGTIWFLGALWEIALNKKVIKT